MIIPNFVGAFHMLAPWLVGALVLLTGLSMTRNCGYV